MGVVVQALPSQDSLFAYDSKHMWPRFSPGVLSRRILPAYLLPLCFRLSKLQKLFSKSNSKQDLGKGGSDSQDAAASSNAKPQDRRFEHFYSHKESSAGEVAFSSLPKLKWFHLSRRKNSITLRNWDKLSTFWSCCGTQKVWSQECKVLEPKQESRSLSTVLDSTSTSLNHFSTSSVFSSTSSGSDVHDSIELDGDAVNIILKRMEEEDKSKQDENGDISFLSAISALCIATQHKRRNKLKLLYTKDELTEAVVVVMEKLPVHSVPTSVLPCCMVAIYNLSKIKPPLDPELESCVLRLAMHGVFTMDIGTGDATKQALYRTTSATLEILLRSLLAEDPTTKHLLRILKHIHFWIHAKYKVERIRAIKSSAALLRFAVLMPDFDATCKLPELGHHVAELAICIGDPQAAVSRHAKESIFRLYELLLHQKGK
ncbi:maestro heat-like repeat family member 5 [Podarcis muralis]